MTEREIKLRVSERVLQAVRHRLAEIEARLVLERHHETNLVLDDKDTTLRRERRLLRVREWDGRLRCTYKGAPTVTDDGVKERAEHEIDLAAGSESEALLALLAGLGYETSLRYDKFREGWRIDDGSGEHEVVLDETPIGCFLEIEGADPRSWMRRLRLEEAEVEHRSYPEIWASMRTENPELPRDMVFRASDLARAADSRDELHQ